jgi:hypothetical protein
MSIKDLFYGKTSYKVVTSSSLDDIGNKVESVEYVEEYVHDKERYLPTVDFGNPAEFAFYGSAEEYYETTIQRIYNQYPYDGSLKERLEFINSSSYIDKWFFENEYPRTNGFVTLGQNWGNADLGSTATFTADSNDFGNDGYVVSPKPQYVFIKGGPHTAAIRPYDGKSLDTADFKNPLHKANIFDQNRDLESNLQVDGLSGSTVEFWFKAGAAPAGTSHDFLGPSPNVALFDLWNSSSLSAGSDNPATYGRFLVEMRREREVSATAVDAIDMAGYQAAGDPSCKFTIAIPVSAGGTGTTVTIKFDISSAGSPTSAGANHITIGTAGSSDTANAALVIKAINGTADSRITYGNSSGDASSGVGIQGITASAGSGGTKVTLTIDLLGESGNISGAIAHGAGTVNLVDVTAFTSGVSELDKFKGDNLFYLTIMSGNSGVDRAPIGAGSLTGSYPLDQWNHYAFTFKNNGSLVADKQLDLKLYINGQLQATVTSGSSIGEISKGPHLANIGAYIYAPNTGSVAGFTAGGRNQEGIGCVSGSFDEFRFWKEQRESSRIFQFYNSHVGGGTNTDPANNHLGVYYKFNEGVTETGSIDQTALDYSGRVSNGLIKNYDPELSMRATASAMVESGASSAEFKDPIIYSYHPEVQKTEEEFILKGKEHDFNNVNMLYNSLPDWILTEDQNTQVISNLFHVISAYFDQLHYLISDIPRLKDITLMSGSTDKPMPFAKELLESTGFFAPELFPNASVINNFLDRDKNGIIYEKSIHDIKNFIYENIYHNLSYINKSKGTPKAIRNLLRCFGVDDELFKINFYANNIAVKPENSYNITTVRKNFVDFNSLARNNATVFQSTASSNTNSSGYLNHSADDSAGFDSDIGMTFESEIQFPSPPNVDEPNFTSGSFGYISSSMFGVHTAKASAADLDWASNDYGNFQVYAVRDEIKSPNSKNAYFQLKSTAGGLLAGNEITSSLFYDVYDNEKWNFAVVVKPAEYPNSTYVSGTTDDYRVEFHGYNMAADTVAESFMVTASISGQAGKRFVSSKKRFYAGAHRTNFVGSVIDPSNIRASGCRIWTVPLTKDEIIAHARDTTNYGVDNPYESAYLNENKSTYTGMIPKIETLAMHWDFETVSGSDGSGEFLVEDLSSGSSDSRYGDWSAILEKQHTGQGMFFETEDSGSISREYISTAKTQFFENLNSENFIEILEKDDEYFQKGFRSRPIRYFFAIEKSMYQSINDEMIDFFGNIAGLQSYASLIGEPVNKYRKDYKKLKLVRGLFFDKIKNTPDLEKYVEFYKWFDDAISAMVLNLIPATSDFAGVQNTVESHILERNKYQHKFPTIDSKSSDISGSIEGINKLKYNWKFGHAPTPPDGGGSGGNSPGNQNINTLWWKQRAERNTFAPSNFRAAPNDVAATAANAIDLDGYQAAGDPSTKFNITIPSSAGGIGTTVTIKFDISSAGSPTSAGANHITIATQGSSDVANAALVIKAINGTTDSRITYGNSSGDASSGVGIKGTTASQGSNTKKVTLTMDKAGVFGNISSAIAHGSGTNLVDVTAFTGGAGYGDIAGVENTRGFIHSASVQSFNRHQGSPTNLKILEFRKEGPKNYRAFFPHLQYDSTNSIEIRSSGISDAIAFSGSDDHKELYPPKKFKATLYGNLGTKEGEDLYNNLFPFSMFSSSLDTKVSRELKEGLIITDQHRDTYHTFENEPLQGPFTNTHVGGNQYRHISLNKGEEEKQLSRNRFSRTGRTSTSLSITTNLDDDETRPEGWIVKFDKPNATAASAIDAIDMAGYQAAGDPSTKFNITIPSISNLLEGTGTAITIKFDISSSGSPTSAGANHITIGTSGSGDAANAALVIKAINGTTDSRITYGNSSGDASSGVGIKGVVASAGSSGTKVTLTMSVAGAIGNVSGAVAHGAGTVNLVDVTAFTGGADGLIKRLRLVSPDFDGTDKPRAAYLRDETAKRPVNIRNIHYTTASQDLGNFTKNYEVVMTSGRDINNQYFKENLGVSVSGSHSTLVSGTSDFTLPDRSIDAYRTKTVIAERFSAPGDPSTLSRGYLDVESESFSAYNNLNYRNFTVRNRLHSMLTASAVEFGLADGLSGLDARLDDAGETTFRRATFHKVNKNSAKRIEMNELNPDGNPASSIASSISAKAIDCIDTTSVGSDTKFTILIPTTAGGESSSTATIIFLDADQTTNPVEGANTIAIGINSVSDANVAALIIKAINGTADSNIDFASSGVGASGVQGVTAVQGSSTTKITLQINKTGPTGNLTNAITTTVAGDHDIVNLRTFSRGDTFAGDDSYQTGSVSDNYYVQHQIPQSVMQYAWITASAVSGPFGFEKPNTAYASMASDDITFVSESDFGIINQSLTNTNSANTLGSNTVGITANRGSTKAKGILSFGGAATADQAVILVSTDGTTKTYVAKASSDFANNQFAVGASAATSAENLKDAINHSSGHAGKIVSVRSGDSVIMLQAEAGEDGNTIIQETLAAATAVGGDQITGNRFTGGASSILKQPLIPLNILRSLDENSLKNNNTLSFIANPEFTQATGEDIYNSLGIASSLNSNLGSIGGAYGYPSWKQWRVGEHPVARYHKKNNIISVSLPKTTIDPDNDKVIMAEDETVSFTEAPLTSKFKPVVHTLNLKKGGGMVVKSSFANNLTRLGNQPVTKQKVPLLDALGVDDSGPEPAVFDRRTKQPHDDIYQLYMKDRNIPDELSPLTYTTPEEPFAKPVRSVTYSEVVFPKEEYTYLNKTRSRYNYTETRDQFSTGSQMSQQRTFWRDAHVDRLRADNDSTLNSLGFKIDKDATKGWPMSATASVSGGIFAVDRSHPSPTTTVTSSGGSAALSIWPLDTDGEGSAVYAFMSSGSVSSAFVASSEDDDRGTLESYYIGRGAGELSNSTDWTLYYRDFPATASIGYNFVQMVHFSGSFLGEDSDGNQNTAGAFNKSAKLPKYQTNKMIGVNPWFDSYEDFAVDVRQLAKDQTILPEFKVSDYMEKYLDAGGVGKTLFKYLELEGSLPGENSGSDNLNIFSLLDKELIERYAETKPMNYYEQFIDQHGKADPAMTPNRFTVSFDGVLKMLPYQGFYPALRTMQLGHMFSQSFGPYIGPDDANNWPAKSDGLRNKATRTAALVQPWFNPGIMFNTIKSGIAVDWPVYKGESINEPAVGAAGDPSTNATTAMKENARRRGSGYISGTIATSDTYKGGPNFRFPFESLVQPERYLPISSSNPDDSGRISHMAPQWKNFYPMHSLLGLEDSGHILDAGTTDAAAGGVNHPSSVTFTFTGAQTDGRKIGFEPLAARSSLTITGTVDTSTATSTATVIGTNGVSNNTDRAQRFYNFLALAITASALPALHATQEDAVVTVESFGATFNNRRDVTNGGGTVLDNVTISNSSKFAGGQEANLAFFDWSGINKPYYSYAMHNFLAEVPNFFLEKGALNSNLTSFVSSPQSKWSNFENGKKYYMDVVLTKNKDMVMFEGPARHMMPDEKTIGTTDHQIGNARGIHYGPALRWTSNSGTAGEAMVRNYEDPAFAAWTPPYFYGTSIARVEFDPSNVATNSTSDTFTLEEIFDKSTVTYINLSERHPEFAQLGTYGQQDASHDGCHLTPASASFMHLSSSMNLFGKAFPNLIKFNSNKNNVLGGLAAGEQEQGEDPVWVISSKFECPVLNFSGNVGPAKGTAETDLTDVQKACFDSQGMWYGSGSIPKGADGISMGLRESFPDETFKPTSTKRSLLSAVGFKPQQQKIGRMASSKKISEAIVAIPYVAETGELFKLNKPVYDIILGNILNGDPDLKVNDVPVISADISECGVGNMIRGMSNYIIPPHFDFRNPEIMDKLGGPFAMYIMEFEHTLDQEDLQNIWQNVMPKIATTAKKSNRTISHQVGVPWEFFNTGLPRDAMKFLIFKVKKRANNNYFTLTPNFDGENELEANGEFDSVLNLGKGNNLPYSYNWPYDFFSLVETGKMECKVKFEPVAYEGELGTEYQNAGIAHRFVDVVDKQVDSKPGSGDET